MVNAAVIGLGWWGQNLVEQSADSATVRVVLGVDPNPVIREQVTERFGIPCAAEVKDALTDDDIDAVIICSPHREHYRQVVDAARAGKHIYCEKPFTATLDEARAALAMVREAGVQLAIGHERRFEPAVQRLQAAVRGGELGTPLLVEANFSHDKLLALEPANWRLSAVFAPVGPLTATVIHLVDLAVNILGVPREVCGTAATLASTFENTDTLSVTLRFESGAIATLASSLAAPFLGRFRVLGSDGWVEIGDRDHPGSPAGWDVTTGGREPGSAVIRFEPATRTVLANLTAFGAAAAGQADYPIRPEEIELVAATCDAITRSVASGRVERVLR
ncbi:Gfo/Idh/MocA family protein [Pseudonocardia sp. RS010]|uniref:Gfo/Idh/MocA family protein n=1 Tax=Pseudonocardia sp. RS010 TaxID=3385979 RepID=UPI0039A3F546